MTSPVVVDINSAVTADSDFPVVHSLAELFTAEIDSVYTWGEPTLRLAFGQSFTEPLGFTTNRYWGQTQYGLQGLSDASRASHTHTLSLRDAILIADNHAVWNSLGEPVLISRGDQKQYNFDYDWQKNCLCTIKPSSYYTLLAGSYFLLSGRWTSHNLYHWIYDSMAKLAIYLRIRSFYPGLKLLLVGRHCQSFHKETFALLNINQEDITVLPFGSQYKLEKLLYTPSIGTCSPVNTPLYLNEVVKLMELELTDDLCRRKDIFINRRPGTRSMTNNNEIESIFRSHGFISIFLEDYTLAEKIMLAQSSRRIAGLGGSGMAMISFMKPRGSVLEITHEKADCPAHLNHAFANKHHYGYLFGQCLPGERIHLNPEVLAQALSLMPL